MDTDCPLPRTDQIRLAPAVSPSTPCFFTPSPRKGIKLTLANSPRVYSSPAQRFTATVASYEEVELESPGGGARAADVEGEDGDEVEPWVDLSPWVDQIPVMLEQDMPMEVVVQMYQRLGLRFVLFTRRGELRGIMTKMASSFPMAHTEAGTD